MEAASNVTLVVLVGVALLMALVVLRAHLTSRVERTVTCPETNRPATIRVAAGHAGLAGPWDRTDLNVDNCSRWSERGRCELPCLGPIAAPGARETPTPKV